MNLEMAHDDWMHRWFNLLDGGLGYFWCGCLGLVALWLGLAWLCVVLAKHSKAPV